MTAYKCDRCGKFYSLEDYENMLGNMDNRGLKCPCVITASGRGRCVGQLRYDGKLDLCPDCTTALAEWVNPKEEE